MNAGSLKIGSSVIRFAEVPKPFTRPNKTEIRNDQRSWKPTPVPMLVMAATFSQTTRPSSPYVSIQIAQNPGSTYTY